MSKALAKMDEHEAAEQWSGWNVALKPAHEPIVVARKPLSEKSVARNVMEHGTGALNIDASRVGTEERRNGPASPVRVQTMGRPEHSGSGWQEDYEGQQVQGRWPANVVLSHSPECQHVGVKRVQGNPSIGTAVRGEDCNSLIGGMARGGQLQPRTSHADPDGLEEVEAWECVDGCPVAELDRQSGTRKSGSRAAGVRSGMGFHGANGDGGPAIEGSEGGASRFFKTFEGEAWECVEGCPVRELDLQSGVTPSGGDLKPYKQANTDSYSGGMPEYRHVEFKRDKGGASRYFKCFEGEPGFKYQAKASRAERNAGLEGMPEKPVDRYNECAQGSTPQQTPRKTRVETNSHPTVKPLALMRYLVKLVTPPGGTCLDPFAGSGSTLVAAIQEGFEAVGIEREAEYCEIAERRVAHARAEIESQPLMLEV